MARLRRVACAFCAVTLISCAEPPSGETGISKASWNRPSAVAEPVNLDCALPTKPETLLDADGLVLKVWTFSLRDVHSGPELPNDPGLLAFRAAIREAGADVRLPSLFVPSEQTQTEPGIWLDEGYNNDQIYRGEVGSIEPITCLDSLLFAVQNARVPQLDYSTEFLASVLRRETSATEEIAVVFGAGDAMFPPKSVYGLDVVDDYLARGWKYWYLLHNHTLQQGHDTITLGVSAPSTVDVRFARSLAEELGLESVRVTNGFYTFNAPVDELATLRDR